MVVEITGPLTFKLRDGTDIALAEVGLPDPAGANAAADAAKDALRHVLQGKEVRLFYEPQPALRSDRHGRKLTQVLVTGDGDSSFWLQKRLVEMGAVLVDSWSSERSCASALLGVEAQAREASQGLWADETNLPLPAERAAEARGRYALIEGHVVSAKKAGSSVYLDFSGDWRKGFAAIVGGRAARLFEKEGTDLLLLPGALVRVRGYVDWGSGAQMALTHPELLEVLQPAPMPLAVAVAAPSKAQRAKPLR